MFDNLDYCKLNYFLRHAKSSLDGGVKPNDIGG
jgi:hypothetical protein